MTIPEFFNQVKEIHAISGFAARSAIPFDFAQREG